MSQPIKSYWEDRYAKKETAWDIGKVSPPLQTYIDQLPDKNISILIPGCGNAYEAAYLLEKGFTAITIIDIAEPLVAALQQKFKRHARQIKISCADFFALQGSYDLILEQTFFCALDPKLRTAYADKMYDLLNENGRLAGVLFNRSFDGGPPFGGTKEEYHALFAAKFTSELMEDCYNSIAPRAGTELFFVLSKKPL